MCCCNLGTCILSLEDSKSLEGSVVWDDLDVDSVGDDLSVLFKLMELGLGELGETELETGSDLLTTGELEHRSSEGLLSVLNVGSIGSDGHEDWSDVYSCWTTVWLTVGLSHTLLESIGSSAWKHLIDSENVPRVNSHSHVESVLTCLGLHVLVSSNTGSFEGLRGDLFLLTWDEMDAVWELVVVSLLSTNIVYSELRIGDSTIVARLGERLVLLVSIAARWSSSHFYIK